MKRADLCRRTLPLSVVLWCGWACAQAPAELKVHLAQANNDSPYAFVRAKFEPGEVLDPWAVRFLDSQGIEVPYFVWDSMTWQVAREGRADWGRRYALINHAPGNTPEVLEARGRKIQWAKKNLPELGARFEARETAAKKVGSSVCAALYILRRHVPALGKERLTMRVYPERQVKTKHQRWQGPQVSSPVSIQQGALSFRDLPDRLSVVWKGKELFRYVGFEAGGVTGTFSHADRSRPLVIETDEGMITKVCVTGQTPGRRGVAMDWQCTYWLFPEGGYVALEGFSPGDTAGYLGGPQKLSLLESAAGFTFSHDPDWERPWWLYQAGALGFVAAHLFYATPLTIGYGNNPFTVNAEGPDKDPRVEAAGPRLALRWFHELSDPAIMRLMARESIKIEKGHTAAGDDPCVKQSVRWDPKVDWLYRQYVVGVGEKPEVAEGAMRCVLGAAAGWIDRPVSEEESASLLVGMMNRIGQGGQSAEIGHLKIVPAVLNDDPAGVREALRDRQRDAVARTDFYINLIRRSVANGFPPAGGGKALPDGTRWEGWTGNPGYHASMMPCYVRVLEFFDIPFPKEAYRQAILRYADFGLELLGGNPVDFNKFRTVLEAEWPSRVVPTIPLMLHAYTLEPDERYARVARMLFEDLMRLVERNPHGYFPAWTFAPKADKYDTVYNPVSFERGITSLWSEGLLDLVGREKASRFVAAQARWFVFSGQLLDTLEMDNVCAIRACNHGGHTNVRNQIGIYLYDDFDFYRGLVAELIAWSAASSQEGDRILGAGTGPYRKLELSNAGSSMIRWALDIRPGGKWLESKVEQLAQSKGFRLRVWNRLPKAEPTVAVRSEGVGLPAGAEVLRVRMTGPAFRQPAEFEVIRDSGKLVLKTNKEASVRLDYRLLRPDWPEGAKCTVVQRQAAERAERLGENVTWTPDCVEWQTAPGEYEIQKSNR